MKKKKKFPDLTGDGKVTRADILKGRGVFKEGGSTVDSSIDRLSKQYSKKTGVSEKEARDLFRKRYQQTAPKPLRKESQAPKAPKPMGKPMPTRPKKVMPKRPEPKDPEEFRKARPKSRPRLMKASGGMAIDKVGNPKSKTKPIQIKGWGKARRG